jgi:cysteinyl-tRNA synthetase
MTPLKLYNTLSRRVELVEPIDGKTVRMYTCGPTPYNFAHIGNFRTYVAVDVLQRALRFLGYTVNPVMQYTDVDDKTIRGSQAAKMPLRQFTAQYREAFQEDARALNILLPEKQPNATDCIGQMVALIERLLARDAAYVSDDGSVYFRISKFPNYGCLAHLDKGGLKAGARVSQDEYQKENVGDFALWKKYSDDDGDVVWDGPRGIKGRPGWHIECSAISMDCLGESFDMHCGGNDLIFPHHENEIAQSEAATGKTFVKHWFHVSHMLVDGQKMAKSLGNFYTVRDVLAKGYTGRELRYALLVAHYRQNLNFTWKGMDDAKAAVARIDEWKFRWRTRKGNDPEAELKRKISEVSTSFLHKFTEAVADDLNLSSALSHLFDYVRETNRLLDQHESANMNLDPVWEKIDGLLGLGEWKNEIPDTVAKLRDERALARKNKDFKKSDELRDQIESLGWKVKDTPNGQELIPL